MKAPKLYGVIVGYEIDWENGSENTRIFTDRTIALEVFKKEKREHKQKGHHTDQEWVELWSAKLDPETGEWKPDRCLEHWSYSRETRGPMGKPDDRESW